MALHPMKTDLWFSLGEAPYNTFGRYIPELLEHNNSKIKEIYTHVFKKAAGKIKNLIDEFL